MLVHMWHSKPAPGITQRLERLASLAGFALCIFGHLTNPQWMVVWFSAIILGLLSTLKEDQ